MTEQTEQETFNATAGRLRSLVERVENLNSELDNLRDDVKNVWAEAKSEGFDVNALKVIVKIRSKDPAKVEEEDAIIETYLKSLKG